MDDALLLLVLPHLQVNCHVVVLDQLEVQRQGLVYWRDVDVVRALVPQANLQILLGVLQVDLVELFELVWLEGGLVDCDWEGEVVEDQHSCNDPEVEERDAGLGAVEGFFLGMRLALADVVEFINHLLILRLLFEVPQFGCLLGDLVDGFLVDHQLDLALVCVIRNGEQEQSSGLLFLIHRTQPQHVVVLSFLDAECDIVDNPRRQQQFLLVIEGELVDGAGIRVADVYRQVDFANDAVLANQVDQVNSLGESHLHSYS